MTKSAPLLTESNCGWILVSARHRYRARHVFSATDPGASAATSGWWTRARSARNSSMASSGHRAAITLIAPHAAL